MNDLLRPSAEAMTDRAPQLRLRVLLPVIALLPALVASPALAEPQQTLGMQGRLLSGAGAPVPDGDYGLSVNFYKAKADDKPVYVEVKPGVKVASGLFAIQVGQVQPLNLGVFTSGDAAWVGLQIGSEQELPRVPLQYVPYALRAQTALELQCSGCVTAAHLAPEVLKPYVKSNDLAGIATTGSFKDLKDVPIQVAVGQQCDADSIATGLDAGGKIVCGKKPSGAEFTISNQTCQAGSVVSGVDASGKITCAVAATGKDFALAGQACSPGAIVTGIDAGGKVQCVAPIAYGGKDFALSGQVCGLGSLVTGVDASGKLQCVAAITYSGKDFALAGQACSPGSLVSGVDAGGKVTCGTPVAYTGKDFAVANQGCASGSLVTGVDAAGKVLCTPVQIYTGKDFALANKACGAGQVVSGIAADGMPVCVPMQTYFAGTGIKLTDNSLSWDTALADTNYVNEGQANAVTGAMIKDAEIKTADLADGSVTAAKLGEPCKDGESLYVVGGKWQCLASDELRSPGQNLLANPALADFDNNGVPDNGARDASNGNWKFAKLAVLDLNSALGLNLAHESVNLWGVDLRSTADGTTESLTLSSHIRPAEEAGVQIQCSVFVRRTDAIGTKARARLDCYGGSVTMDIPTGDLAWHRMSLTVAVVNSSKVPQIMRVFGSGNATGGDPSFVRYAMPKIEYGKVATAWNGASSSYPTGMIAFFAGPCPAGWAEYTALRGRALVGTPNAGQIAATLGSALGDLGKRTITDVPTHTHDVDPPNTGSTSNGDHLHGVDPPSTGSSSNGDHAHSVDPPSTGTSGGGDHSHQINTSANFGSCPGSGIHRVTFAGDGANACPYPTGAYTAGAGTHSHAVDIGGFNSAAAGTHAHTTDIGGFNSAAAGTHAHTTDVGNFASAATGIAAVDVTMPYIQLTACRAN